MLDLPQHRTRLAALAGVLEDLPDPVLLVGEGGLVEEVNAAARALLPGVKAGRHVSSGVRAPEILDAIAAASTTRSQCTVEYRERVPYDRTFAVQIRAVARDSEAVGRAPVLLFFRDLTDAQRLERMRVDFIANVSHELRTPLASLIGFIETLQGPAREDATSRDRFLEIMRRQAWRMTRLIDDLLSLSRTEMREHVAPDGIVDVNGIATHMIDTLRPMATERGVDIQLYCDREPASVRGDADELLRAVENLVENAVKYGESGNRVEVAVARRPSEVELSVRDYGPGIAPEHLPRLTERFYRADVSESREKGGTGLGLAIVKHIVSRHRGRLRIESDLGAGATFRMILPAHLESGAETAR